MAELVQLEAQTHAVLYSWDNLSEADTDPPYITLPFRADATLAAWGAPFGETTWQGSWQTQTELEAGAVAVWFTLTDPFDAPIVLAAPGAKVRHENCILLRPLITGGAGVVVTARALLTGNRG